MKRRFIIIGGGILLLLLVAALFSGLDRTPTYNGKSVRQWASGLKTRTVKYPDLMAAFRNTGTNPVPYLLREVQREETGWQTFKLTVWSRLPAFLQKKISAPPRLEFSNYEVFVVNQVRAAGPESTGLVLAALRDRRPEVRAASAWILGGFKTNWAAIVPELTKALSDPDASVRSHAADSLGQIGPDSVAAVPALINLALNDTDKGPTGRPAFVRDAALRALGKIGPAAREASPALKQILQSGNQRWVVFAAIALWKVDRDTSVALPVLTNQYVAWSNPEKWTILQTFGDMGTNALSTVPLITGYLRKNAKETQFPWTEIQEESQKALRLIDPAAAEAIEKELQLKPLRKVGP